MLVGDVDTHDNAHQATTPHLLQVSLQPGLPLGIFRNVRPDDLTYKGESAGSTYACTFAASTGMSSGGAAFPLLLLIVRVGAISAPFAPLSSHLA
jgi:hypothetical protein